MAETEPQSGSGSGLRSAFNTLLILALLGVVGWLAAERNNHHYFIHTEGRAVLIERGWELPYGHGPYHPRDPGQGQAYAAIHLPDGTKGPVEEEFEERGDLDRRLGDILLEAAKTRLAQSDAARLPEGIAYLDQAALLQQLTTEQRHQIQSQRAEVAYFEASDRIARALAALQDARGLLKLASTGSHSNARDAADLLDRMGPPLEALLRATRSSAIMPADEAELPPASTPTTIGFGGPSAARPSASAAPMPPDPAASPMLAHPLQPPSAPTATPISPPKPEGSTGMIEPAPSAATGMSRLDRAPHGHHPAKRQHPTEPGSVSTLDDPFSR